MDLKDAKEWRERYVADDKEYRKGTQDKSDFDKFCDTHIEAIETVLHKLAELEKENKELKNNKTLVEKILTKGKGFTLEQSKYIWEKYISKVAIKKKIEELENYLQENTDEQGYWGTKNPDEIHSKIDVLEELLGEEI